MLSKSTELPDNMLYEFITSYEPYESYENGLDPPISLHSLPWILWTDV